VKSRSPVRFNTRPAGPGYKAAFGADLSSRPLPGTGVGWGAWMASGAWGRDQLPPEAAAGPVGRAGRAAAPALSRRQTAGRGAFVPRKDPARRPAAESERRRSPNSAAACSTDIASPANGTPSGAPASGTSAATTTLRASHPQLCTTRRAAGGHRPPLPKRPVTPTMHPPRSLGARSFPAPTPRGSRPLPRPVAAANRPDPHLPSGGPSTGRQERRPRRIDAVRLLRGTIARSAPPHTNRLCAPDRPVHAQRAPTAGHGRAAAAAHCPPPPGPACSHALMPASMASARNTSVRGKERGQREVGGLLCSVKPGRGFRLALARGTVPRPQATLPAARARQQRQASRRRRSSAGPGRLRQPRSRHVGSRQPSGGGCGDKRWRWMVF
jgi:hypothetical protein